MLSVPEYDIFIQYKKLLIIAKKKNKGSNVSPHLQDRIMSHNDSWFQGKAPTESFFLTVSSKLYFLWLLTN